jgi:hypothetical protein
MPGEPTSTGGVGGFLRDAYGDVADFLIARENRKAIGSNAPASAVADQPNSPPPSQQTPSSLSFADLIAGLPSWAKLALGLGLLSVAGAVVWKAVK